jgi:cytochrome c oxidase subunit II
MFVLFIGAAILGTSVLFSQINDRQAAANAEKTAGPQLKLVASNFKFDQPQYEVKAGVKMKVSLILREGFHGAEIVGTPVKLDKNTPSMDYTFDKPGQYEIHCSVPCGTGHADMKTLLVVK